jgi:hypothetical protein
MSVSPLCYSQLNLLCAQSMQTQDRSQMLQPSPESEANIQAYLNETYARFSSSLEILRRERTSLRPYFRRRLFEITDKISVEEGLKESELFEDNVSMQLVIRGDFSVDWPAIMRWATGQPTFNIVGGRIKRSKLAFDGSYQAWYDAYANIKDLITNHLQLEPNIRQSLQNLNQLGHVLGILSVIKDGEDLQMPLGVDENCSQMKYDAMELKWETLEQIRRDIKHIIPLGRTSSLIRRSILTSSGIMPPDTSQFIKDVKDLNDLF